MRTTTARRPPIAADSTAAKSRQRLEAALPLFDLRKKPGYCNASAKAALLRRTKAAPHDELFIDFSRPECFVELRASGATLLSGTWTFQATAGNQPLISTAAWQESCWETDDECDYLEIELPLSGGWRLERQMLLAREGRFLLLADALLGPAGDNTSSAAGNALRGVPGAAKKSRQSNGSSPNAISSEKLELHYSTTLALAPQAAFRPADETREGRLESKNRRLASAIPLALPEWRAEFCHAELTPSDGQLKLEQKSLGANLYAPLWIDLNPRRLRRPLTWRRLTVAENLAAVPRDAAAAYRIQSGREQWLVYRSLAKVGNRSFLGHNTLFEFVCRRFLPTGDTGPIIEIE